MIPMPPAATPLSAAKAMQLALSLAAQAASSAAPNPAVGCVLLSAEGRLIGAGHIGSQVARAAVASGYDVLLSN